MGGQGLDGGRRSRDRRDPPPGKTLPKNTPPLQKCLIASDSCKFTLWETVIFSVRFKLQNFYTRGTFFNLAVNML